MMKKLKEVIVSLLVVAALLYIVIFIIGGFPHPKWATDGVKEYQQIERN